MPIYEYRCEAGHVTDAYRTVANRHDCPACDRCASATEKIISRPAMTMPDIAGYTSVLDGSRVESRSAHREHMARHGVIEVGNERLPERKRIERPTVREDIVRAMEMTR